MDPLTKYVSRICLYATSYVSFIPGAGGIDLNFQNRKVTLSRVVFKDGGLFRNKEILKKLTLQVYLSADSTRVTFFQADPI